MIHEPDSLQHDDSCRESHASDGTAFGHVGQPSTPIDDEIEREIASIWPILVIRCIRGDEEVVRAVNRFVKARTKLRELDDDRQMQSPLEDSIITVQNEYAAARSALDKLADVDAAATGDGSTAEEEDAMKQIQKFEDTERCTHPEHNPPSMIVLEPGVYEHACPGCGKTQTVVQPLRPTC